MNCISIRRFGLPMMICLMVSMNASADDSKPKDRIDLKSAVRERCINVLREGLHSDEFWPSIHAAEGMTLGRFGAEVRKFLEPKLKTEADDQKRCGISRELVRAGAKSYRDIMLTILSGDDPHGHVHAAESLYKVGEVGDGKAMRRAFGTSEKPPLQIMSAAALGRAGNPQAMKFLRKTLADAEPSVARLAAWVLARIGNASDIEPIRKQLSRTDDPVERAFFEHALASLGDKNGLAALLANLKSQDAVVRTYAAVFAGDARAVSAAPQLILQLDDENLDARLRAAQSLLVLSQPSPPSRTEDISTIVYAATKKNPRYTEGSILEAGDGSLRYATTEFFGTGSDFSQAHIVVRHSADEGRTWSPSHVLQANTGKKNVMSATLRRLSEPAAAGAVGFFYLQKDDFDDLNLFVRTSNRESVPFGEPVLITRNPGYHVVNNDRITQLSTGRILAPAASTPDVKDVNHFVSHCYISDDGGGTWRNGKGSVDLPKRGAMEPEVIELTDGRVLMIMRNQLGFISKSYSTDGGDTWSKPESLGVRAPEAPSTLRRIPSTGDLILIWNDTYTPGAGHGGKRTPLTAAVSSDEGMTWKNVRNLESRSDRTYSYVSLIFIRDRAVMSYWESAPEFKGYSGRFRSLPVSWFYGE